MFLLWYIQNFKQLVNSCVCCLLAAPMWILLVTLRSLAGNVSICTRKIVAKIGKCSAAEAHYPTVKTPPKLPKSGKSKAVIRHGAKLQDWCRD